MAKLILLVLFCCLGLTQTMLAQTNLKEHHKADIIFFKSGGVLYGKILSIEDDIIQFEMVTEKVIEFEMKAVKKIIQKFDAEGTAEIQSYLRKPYQFKEKGIYNFTFINFPQGFNERDVWNTGLGLHHVTGKQFNRWLGTGIGIGFDGYQIGNGRNVLSVYADFRGYTQAKNFSPFYALGLGYGFGVKNREIGIVKTKGGLYCNPTVGYRFGGSAGANFVLGLGYRLQIATFEWNGWDSVNRHRYVFKRLNLNVGVLF